MSYNKKTKNAIIATMLLCCTNLTAEQKQYSTIASVVDLLNSDFMKSLNQATIPPTTLSLDFVIKESQSDDPKSRTCNNKLTIDFTANSFIYIIDDQASDRIFKKYKSNGIIRTVEFSKSKKQIISMDIHSATDFPEDFENLFWFKDGRDVLDAIKALPQYPEYLELYKISSEGKADECVTLRSPETSYKMDKAHGVLINYTGYGDDHSTPRLSFDYSDYKSFNGFMLPLHIIQRTYEIKTGSARGSKDYTVKSESVKVNFMLSSAELTPVIPLGTTVFDSMQKRQYIYDGSPINGAPIIESESKKIDQLLK